MELMEMQGYEGFSQGRPEYAGIADDSDSEITLNLNTFDPEELQKCVRIFPHKMDGEGHFLALFHKKAILFHLFSVSPQRAGQKHSEMAGGIFSRRSA